MAFIEPGVLEGIRGSALFYPAAGLDTDEALNLFVPTIGVYWFVDVGYFRSPGTANASEPSVSGRAALSFEGFELVGPPVASLETRTDDSGRAFKFLEPCTRSEFYRHRPSNSRIVIHWRRGFAQRSIACVDDIGVFFHRGDSPGEGGSGVYWLSNRCVNDVTSRLRPGGVVVTDGSNANAKALRRFHNLA